MPAPRSTIWRCRCRHAARAVDPRAQQWPEDGYRGDYINDVAKAYLAGETIDAQDRHVTGAGEPNDLDAIREFAVAYLRREQDLDLKAFGVHFDLYFLESSLYASGAVEATVERLVANAATPMSRTAHCGCEPQTSAMTRTG